MFIDEKCLVYELFCYVLKNFLVNDDYEFDTDNDSSNKASIVLPSQV